MSVLSMNNLAIVQRDQGKYEQMGEIHRQESVLCERVLGKEHPETLMSMSNWLRQSQPMIAFQHESIIPKVITSRC